ncbi:MAG: nitrite reductase small subunit NirD [Thermoleophilaceae bacterium]
MSAALSLRETRVCDVEDVPIGEGRVVSINERPIAVFRTDAGWYALDNTCTHMGGPLADGMVADESVACPLHDRRFELATGRPIGHECGAVASYPVEVRDDEVFLTIALPGSEEIEVEEAESVIHGSTNGAASADAEEERGRTDDAEAEAAEAR